MSNVNDLYPYILKDGLQRYKFKHSHTRPTDYQEKAGKKGVSFVFRSKEHMANARGFIVTSEEAIQANKDTLSHWTPNVYGWGGYADPKRHHVLGFFEENLMQINTYVIDIDCAKDVVSSDDILLAGIDLGVTPTLIVESPNGYQAYFVLDRPSFVSKAQDYKSLRTNKAIARSLKLAFSTKIEGVDFGCNPFGIFRFPNEENIVFYEPDNVFSFKTLMAWSMKVSDDHQQEQQEQHMKKFMVSDFKQTQTSWFRSLLKQSDIKGGKGVLGRNSALFAASLACYSSQLDQETCIELMTEFNASLTYPLSEKELKKTIRSAYSGRYKGASAQYIQLLNEQWGSDDTRAESLNKGVWYKFAKPRDDRQKSHYSEWRKDLIRLIEQKATKQ
ncbi:MAG: primase C-terminal domain-containing protein, partial [Alkalibacterium sp.]|nr:primase C-terminal domain-containing protein [Alkalibacterium sp.]